MGAFGIFWNFHCLLGVHSVQFLAVCEWNLIPHLIGWDVIVLIGGFTIQSFVTKEATQGEATKAIYNITYFISKKL